MPRGTHLALVLVQPAGAQTGSGPILKGHRTGDALQGIVPINGSTDVAGFVSAEIAFSYMGDATGTWFLIAALDTPIKDGTLSTWDTTSITDGNYILRLRVTLTDATFRDVTVTNLRVRNYTAMETPTPAPTAKQPTLAPTITLTPTAIPTPTPLPTNQAILSPMELSVSIGYGGVGAIALLGIIGIYLWLRRK